MKPFLLLVLILMCPKAFSFSSPLKACPDKPNCVYSKATDEHAIAPFFFTSLTGLNFEKIVAVIKQLEKHVSVTTQDGHIHAEITSRVFGFVDDLDLILDAEQNTLHVRSASRKGYYDLGVNRRRVERLRAALQKANIIK